MVIGIVQATINPLAVLQQSGGNLPQNVNFAIKSDVAAEFVNSNAKIIDLSKIHNNLELDFSEIEKSVVKVQSGIIPEGLEDKSKFIVLFQYKTIWDVWYRFKYFVLSFYDFDTQNLIFEAGQGYDNALSTEGVVISDTFEKIKTTLGQENGPIQ